VKQFAGVLSLRSKPLESVIAFRVPAAHLFAGHSHDTARKPRI